MLKRLSPFHTGDGPPPASYTPRGGLATSSLGAGASSSNGRSPSPSQGYFSAQPPPLSSRTSFASDGARSPAPHQHQPMPPIDPNRLLGRGALQKSLLAVESLLQALDEYRNLSARLAKAQKRLARAARDLATGLPCSPQERPDATGASGQESP
jgi:hypothetical protein